MKSIRTGLRLGLCLLLILAMGGVGVRAQDPQVVQASKQHGPVYVNRQYRFKLTLPPGWEGYSVVKSEWNDSSPTVGAYAKSGPQLTFRHPKWTEANPYQDIPIMIFTKAQWAHIDDLVVNAAPFPPEKIAENAQYVFALPPRWVGYSDALQSHEVGEWMAKQRLHAY
ncbi:MAG TPA: hypothetical protein VHZ52_05540 [Acidobacteriaceae bacterium]|nr:hypothetical protein [Acidobacteriaceae bacterium]